MTWGMFVNIIIHRSVSNEDRHFDTLGLYPFDTKKGSPPHLMRRAAP